MFYTVYKIVNNINQKEYIGQHKTNNLNDGYMGSGILLHNAIKNMALKTLTKSILQYSIMKMIWTY